VFRSERSKPDAAHEHVVRKAVQNLGAEGAMSSHSGDRAPGAYFLNVISKDPMKIAPERKTKRTFLEVGGFWRGEARKE